MCVGEWLIVRACCEVSVLFVCVRARVHVCLKINLTGRTGLFLSGMHIVRVDVLQGALTWQDVVTYSPSIAICV